MKNNSNVQNPPKADKIDELLTRGVEEVIEIEHLKKRLFESEKLRVKFGIDPTSPDLHLGHTVPLRKLRQFQDLGHKVILLIGDYTALIGDPSGKSATRKMLSKENVQENLRDYQNQAGKILDMEKVEVRFNSEWYKDKGADFFLELTSKITVARAIERDDFKKRMKDDIDVSVLEIMYPLMQGYDSVELEADVEIGGTDQKFNLLMGRKIQKRYDKKEQDVMTVPLLEGIDGADKMGKSLGNYIGITEIPEVMFGKIMSIPDSLIVKYLRLLTNIPEENIKKIEEGIKMETLNPRDSKMDLAEELVRMYHGEKEARGAKEYFVNTFSKKETPTEIREVKIEKDEVKLTEFLVLAEVAESLSDARRKIEQGGVSIDGKKVEDWKLVIDKTNDRSTLKVGKIHFVRIRFK